MTKPAKAAGLTLAGGAKPVSFKALDARGYIRRETESARQERLTLAAYPELKKLEGQAGFVDHPDWPDYAGQLDLRVNYWPWVAATLVAGDTSLTLDEFLGSDMSDILACLGAILRLNEGFRALFPPLVQRNYPPLVAEGADPNA